MGILLKDLEIPVIKENEITVQEHKDRGMTSIFYGCSDIGKKEECKKVIDEKLLEFEVEEYHFPYDFKIGTSRGFKKWYMEDRFNIYQDKGVTEIFSVVQRKGYIDGVSTTISVKDDLALWVFFKGKKK